MYQQETAEEVLGEHLESLGDVIQRGFDRYQRTPDRHLHSARSRASLIHDYIVHEAQKLFSDVRTVRCFFRDNLFLISFGYGKVILRLKKLGEGFRASNQTTIQSSLFESSAQSEMFGDSILLTAGYSPDASFTSIRSKVLTYFYAGKMKWTIDIPSYVDNLIEFPLKDEAVQFGKGRIRHRASEFKLEVVVDEGNSGKS